MGASKELLYTANLMKTMAEFDSMRDLTLVAGMDDKRYVQSDADGIKLCFSMFVYSFELFFQILGTSTRNGSSQQAIPSPDRWRKG